MNTATPQPVSKDGKAEDLDVGDLLQRRPLLRGSLVKMARRCGKSHCPCARGKLHRSLYLAVRRGPRRVMIYIPTPLEGWVRGCVATYREAERLMEKFSRATLAQFLHDKKNAGLRPRIERRKGIMEFQLARTTFDSPLGEIHLAATPAGLAALYFEPQRRDMEARLARRFGELPPVLASGSPQLPAILRRAVTALEGYFEGKIGALRSLALDVEGTQFERSVWETLRAVAPGETTTYGTIAARLSNPQASRAVGRATGRNPVSLVIPCHRALGAGHKLTGYAGGIERKRYLLDLEAQGTLSLAGA